MQFERQRVETVIVKPKTLICSVNNRKYTRGTILNRVKNSDDFEALMKLGASMSFDETDNTALFIFEYREDEKPVPEPILQEPVLEQKPEKPLPGHRQPRRKRKRTKPSKE